MGVDLKVEQPTRKMLGYAIRHELDDLKWRSARRSLTTFFPSKSSGHPPVCDREPAADLLPGRQRVVGVPGRRSGTPPTPPSAPASRSCQPSFSAPARSPSAATTPTDPGPRGSESGRSRPSLPVGGLLRGYGDADAVDGTRVPQLKTGLDTRSRDKSQVRVAAHSPC